MVRNTHTRLVYILKEHLKINFNLKKNCAYVCAYINIYIYKNTGEMSLLTKAFRWCLIRSFSNNFSNCLLTSLRVDLLCYYVWEHKIKNKYYSFSYSDNTVFPFQDRKCAEPAVLQSVPKWEHIKKTLAVWSLVSHAKHGGLRTCAQVVSALLRQQKARD